MMIELQGDTAFEATRELLWEMILDPEVLARILPGCNRLEIVNENEYQGQMKIKIGPVDGVFQGTVALSELRPLEGFHLAVNGRGPSGVVKGEGDVSLVDGAEGTQFHYSGSGQISGRMASVGQRVMNSSAKAVVKQSLENLDKQVQARTQPEPANGAQTAGAEAPRAAEAPEPPPAPSQTEFMVGVAENMLEELVPDPQQRKLVGGVAVAAALLFLLNLFANMVARRVVRMIKEEANGR
jgi:carbon monoxide dehydrogenase subunit G